jgi:hypothetical protein
MAHGDHLTDPDIVLLIDGELQPAQQRDVREHLDTCPSCRERVAEFEGAITEFIHAYRGSPDTPPIAGPRALLRARLENCAPAKNSGWFAGQRAAFPARIAASLMVACLALFAVFDRGMSRRTGDLSIPRKSLTPGETRHVTIGDVCSGAPEQTVRTVPVSLRQQVFQEYGIDDKRPNAYEVDYLITPELGGASSIRNLWPQPYSTVWNARVKDELEDRLHGLVCAGQVDLETAQRDISRDWIGAYKKYFHTDKPF